MFFKTIPENFLHCGRVPYSAWIAHWPQGIQLPWRGVLVSAAAFRNIVLYVSNEHPNECQEPRFHSRTFPRASYYLRGLASSNTASWCHLIMLEKKKHDSSDQASSYHCCMVQFWYSCMQCRHFQWFAKVSKDTLPGLAMQQATIVLQ